KRNSFLSLVQPQGWKNYPDKRNSFLCLVQLQGWKNYPDERNSYCGANSCRQILEMSGIETKMV
ncbi:hypothetical protein, partial [Phormidium sp. CCY1219]|uniref:hypothetical protein n=1 Tax=Phormidium sp. CCY1219 TaxID=2886104 RepID=UPI002D1EB21B